MTNSQDNTPDDKQNRKDILFISILFTIEITAIIAGSLLISSAITTISLYNDQTSYTESYTCTVISSRIEKTESSSYMVEWKVNLFVRNTSKIMMYANAYSTAKDLLDSHVEGERYECWYSPVLVDVIWDEQKVKEGEMGGAYFSWVVGVLFGVVLLGAFGVYIKELMVCSQYLAHKKRLLGEGEENPVKKNPLIRLYERYGADLE
eukprot:TRINITY_DN2294_c0_g1_i1.p1 TRINITY_DN2294_c0_g1~~TRINITY_DN2294_c0_g1_i1.p1  ORF type:complete len:206 (+),score=33.83 TRINITY_DN2294_c0_g1_i1:47-664(+)